MRASEGSMESSAAARSGDGTVENVGIKINGTEDSNFTF